MQLQKEIGESSTFGPNGRLTQNPRTVHHDWPLVSVIIPTYNSAAYLPHAIDTVLAQNYPNVEIIVVDDGSTDNTNDVLAPYQKNIRIIFQKNAGSAAARNRGIAEANGELIVFLDADDLLLPDKLHAQATRLVADEALGMVHSGWLLIDESGKQIGEKTPWREAPTLDVESWLRVKPIKLGAIMVRRSWLQKVGGFDPALRQSQDSDLLLRLALEGCRAVWYKAPTLAYRVYRDSTIRRNAPAQFRYLLKVHEKAFAHPNLPRHLKPLEQQFRYYTIRWVIWHIFSEGFLDDLSEPMADFAHSSRFDAVDTAADLLVYLGEQLRRVGRPFTDLNTIQPALMTALPIQQANMAPAVRFARLVYDNEMYDLLGEDPHKAWRYWHTTFDTKDDATPAQKLRFLLALWEPFVVEERPLAQPAAPLTDLTAAQITAAGQHALVNRYRSIEPETVKAVYELTGSSDRTVLVAWLLTLAGQAALRQERRRALRAFVSACYHTLLSQRAWAAWQRFLKKSVQYYGQQRI